MVYLTNHKLAFLSGYFQKLGLQPMVDPVDPLSGVETIELYWFIEEKCLPNKFPFPRNTHNIRELQVNKKAHLVATHSIGGLGVPENERITTGAQMVQTIYATRQIPFVF